MLLQMAIFHSFFHGRVIFHCIHKYINIFFIHASVDGQLGCFHILAIVLGWRKSLFGFPVRCYEKPERTFWPTQQILLLWTLGCMYLFHIFLDMYLEVEFLGHMVVLVLVFWRTSILFSVVAAPIYIPTNSVQGFPFLYILANICCL